MPATSQVAQQNSVAREESGTYRSLMVEVGYLYGGTAALVMGANAFHE